MSVIKYYKNKNQALLCLTENNLSKIICNRGITKYFLMDNHESFINFIKKCNKKDFYEFIPSNKPICFYYDIEIYDETVPLSENDINIEQTSPENILDNYYLNYESLVNECIQKVFDTVSLQFPEVQMKRIVLESHSDIKRSFHIILRFIDTTDNKEILFENVQTLKALYKDFGLNKYIDSQNRHLIDPSVYREGLFRTLYSTKNNEVRPFKRSDLSDEFEDVESLVCYTLNAERVRGQDTSTEAEDCDLTGSTRYKIIDSNKFNKINEQVIELKMSDLVVNIPEELNDDDKTKLRKFIQKEYHHFPNKIRDVFIDKDHNCIVISLMERYCPFLDKEHRGNNQYIVIDTCGAKQKCHNTECNQDKYNEIKLENYPVEINEVIKKCLKVNQQELELIDHAIIECKHYINENFDKDMQEVQFDRKEMIFRGSVGDKNLVRILKGKCPECNVEHHISDTGYCLKCSICKSIFPKTQIIPIDNRYKHLNSFWMNYNQLVNHGTINNIINIYNNNGEMDFSCDIKLDDTIFKNKDVTNIINQVLDGHKITMISKLLFFINKDFVYSRNNWYYFNSSIWRSDNDNIEMKKCIIDLSKMFDKIKTHYDNKNTDDTTMTLNKNIKSLINKFHKPGYQDDIIKGAKIYNNQH